MRKGRKPRYHPPTLYPGTLPQLCLTILIFGRTIVFIGNLKLVRARGLEPLKVGISAGWSLPLLASFVSVIATG
jgi:hypothetical protein